MDAQLLMRSLVDLRKDRGIFQKDLARQLGIQPASLSAMENGSYTPSVKQIDQYAAVFGFEVGLKRQEGLEYQNDPLSDKTIYSLRLFDKELLQFSMQKDSPGHLEISLLSVNRETVHLLPPGLELSPDGLMKWLSQRTIPKNRAFVNEILYSLNLQPGDLKGIIDVCMGLSLNDSYWIVPEDFSGTFSQYNLYENRFSEALSLVAYTGYADRVHLFTTSPELTTDGALPKAWKFIPGQGILLFKQGTWGASNAGREPYCESDQRGHGSFYCGL